MPLQAVQVNLDTRPQLDADHVARPPVLDAGHLSGLLDDPFGEQEPDGQLAILAGRPHRHRDPPAHATAVLVECQANLQRLLDRQLIGPRDRPAVLNVPYRHCRYGQADPVFRPIGPMHCLTVPGRDSEVFGRIDGKDPAGRSGPTRETFLAASPAAQRCRPPRGGLIVLPPDIVPAPPPTMGPGSPNPAIVEIRSIADETDAGLDGARNRSIRALRSLEKYLASLHDIGPNGTA